MREVKSVYVRVIFTTVVLHSSTRNLLSVSRRAVISKLVSLISHVSAIWWNSEPYSSMAARLGMWKLAREGYPCNHSGVI